MSGLTDNRDLDKDAAEIDRLERVCTRMLPESKPDFFFLMFQL